jgi:hypothetical protein
MPTRKSWLIAVLMLKEAQFRREPCAAWANLEPTLSDVKQIHPPKGRIVCQAAFHESE